MKWNHLVREKITSHSVCRGSQGMTLGNLIEKIRKNLELKPNWNFNDALDSLLNIT